MPTRKEKLRKKRHQQYLKESHVPLLVSESQKHILTTTNGIESKVVDSTKQVLVKNGVQHKTMLAKKYVAPIRTRFSARLASKAGKIIPEVNIVDVIQTSMSPMDTMLPPTNIAPLQKTKTTKVVASSEKRFSLRLASKVGRTIPLLTILDQTPEIITTTAVITKKQPTPINAVPTKPTVKSKNVLQTKKRFCTPLASKVGRMLPPVPLVHQTMTVIPSPVGLVKKRAPTKNGLPSKSPLKSKTAAVTKHPITVTLDPKVGTTTPLVYIPQRKQQPWRQVSRQFQPVSKYPDTIRPYSRGNIRMAELKRKFFENRVVSNVMRNAKKSQRTLSPILGKTTNHFSSTRCYANEK